MNIKELVDYGKKLLKENDIEDYNIIAKTLVKYILKIDDAQIILQEENEVEEEDKTRYYLAVIEVISGFPVQYITNKQEFYGLEFYVDQNVLIPQPDTEILVEEVINIIKNNKEFTNNVKILDMCTGSGCIGISIAKNIENCNVEMLDYSSDALDVAKINANKILGNLSNIKFIQSDMYEELEEEYDIIVSNPPYIKTEEIETLSEEVKHEPELALDGGEDGLAFYKELIEESHKYLSDNGYLCMEIGYNQKDDVTEMLEKNGNYYDIYSKKDLSGNDRIIIAKRKQI